MSMADLEGLQKDAQSRDFLWSLFVAAAKSYRFSSVLHPFPPPYYARASDQKNMVLLREEIFSFPPLNNIDGLSKMSSSCQDLIRWVLTTQNFELQLKERTKCMKKIIELTGQMIPTPEPSYIFEVIPSNIKEQKFQELRNGRDVFYAYHGSRFDNFYSILHNGLNGHLNKVSAFGEGTYLSSELSLCLLFSPGGEGWKKSMLGSKLGCVAVCELIDDPSVKCQIKEGTVKEKKSRAQASQAVDAVPEKYYLVQNNDMMRIRYLLVYKSENTQRSQNSSRYDWILEHKFMLIILAYVLLLVAIGIANSPQTVNSISRIYRKLTHW